MRDELSIELLELADDFARAASESAVWAAATLHGRVLLGADCALVLRRGVATDPDYTAFSPVFVPAGAGHVSGFQAVASLTGRGLVAAPPPGTPGAAPFRPLFEAVSGLAPGGVVYAPLNLQEVLLLIYRDEQPRLERLGWVLLDALSVQASAALERVRAVERVAELSLRDVLTGVGNRRLLEVVLERSFPRALRGEALAVVVIRPAVGAGEHPEGVDVMAARRLQPHVRESDVLARFSEGVFVVVLHGCEGSGVELFVKRVSAELPGAGLRVVTAQADSRCETAGELLATALAQPLPVSSH